MDPKEEEKAQGDKAADAGPGVRDNRRKTGTGTGKRTYNPVEPQLHAKRNYDSNRFTPQQIAKVIALRAEGNTTTWIARKMGRPDHSGIAKLCKRHEERIEKLSEEIMEDRVERYTTIITKTLDALERRLDEMGWEMGGGELSQILKTAFEKRQLLKDLPTSITRAEQTHYNQMDAILMAEDWEDGYKQKTLAEIRALPDGDDNHSGEGEDKG